MSKAIREGAQLTIAQYERLPRDDRYIDELSRGLLVREPRPGAEHSYVTGNLFSALRNFVEGNDLGLVRVESGFRLAAEPPTVRGPDVAFVAKARLPAQLPAGFLEVAPDLAIEVLSPSNRARVIAERIRDYFAAGTTETWIVQPRSRTVVIHTPTDEIRLLDDVERLTTPLLPGLALPVVDLFESCIDP